MCYEFALYKILKLNINKIVSLLLHGNKTRQNEYKKENMNENKDKQHLLNPAVEQWFTLSLVFTNTCDPVWSYFEIKLLFGKWRAAGTV